MILDDKYRQEVDKITYLKNVDKPTFRFSNILLFREYQSRLYAWKDRLNFKGEDLFNKSRPFHNLFNDLSPNWIDNVISEEKIIKDLEILGVCVDSSTRYFDGFFVSMLLNWEIFKDTSEIKVHSDLPHPYKPVFQIISRGGSVIYQDMYLVIDSIGTYLKHNGNFKLPSLDENFLAYVDKNVISFPNQTLVNELWEQFKALN